MTKVLFVRFGGVGDSISLTPVAYNLKKKHPDYQIHFGVRGTDQVSLFSNLDLFHRVFEIQRFPHPFTGGNCVKVKGGWEALENYKKNYDVVYDFVNLVENNTMHPEMTATHGEWAASMNSNYFNWIDIALSWVNIDHTKVKPEDKRLHYKLEEKEVQWAQEILSSLNFSTLIGVNTVASSRARSYFDVESVVKEVLDSFEKPIVLAWDNNRWISVSKGGSKELIANPTIRQSAALLSLMDAYISTDSGFSHIAEAVGTKTVIIYTTVPAWTRSGYYQNCFPIEVELPCSPCFTLLENCPVNRKRAMENLSEREKSILTLSNQNISPIEASKHLATTQDKLMLEYQSLQAKMHGLSSIIPDCMASITPDLVVEKLKGIMK